MRRQGKILKLGLGGDWNGPEAEHMNRGVESLRVSLSKIAPLELWNASWSTSGPRVCWRLFRPTPQPVNELFRIIGNFRGHAQWHFVENCLEVGAGLTTFPRGFTTPSSVAPVAITPLSEADATSDLLALANEIEDRLDLCAVEPKSFSEALLTKDGLRKSRGPFEDFQDGGQRIAYLIVQPGAWKLSQPTEADITKADIMLHFEPHLPEMTAIFGDIVGSDLTQRNLQTLTGPEADGIERAFPVLWKISEYYEDAYLSPQEADSLSRECVALDRIVSSRKAIRGLDKLSRIAEWASEKHYGVLFAAP